MTAAVPDPRFRDQLARLFYRQGDDRHIADWRASSVEEFVAAEVEARVQAAANQRAVEELEAEAAYDDAAPEEQYSRGLFARRLRVRAENLRAALASPAPAPRDEEGQ